MNATRFGAAVLVMALGWLTHAAAQEEAPASGLEVSEMVLSKALENGQPVDPTTTFSRRDGRIYCTVRVNNPSRTATTIRVAWEKVGGPASTRGVVLEIPARPRYRTVARTGTGASAGRYRCVVYDTENRELSAAEYDLTE